MPGPELEPFVSEGLGPYLCGVCGAEGTTWTRVVDGKAVSFCRLCLPVDGALSVNIN